MTLRYALAAGMAGLTLAACATVAPEPVCRAPSEAERQLFAAIVAHDEARLADLLAPGDARLAGRIRDLEQPVADQIFGRRMGDRSVRSVLMQPPLCLVDAPLTETERVTYVFPSGRFEGLQNPELPGPELGRGGVDHAACRFVLDGDRWRLSDACLATFSPGFPAG